MTGSVEGRLILGALVAFSPLVAPTGLAAQAALSVSAGAAMYDLSGVGTSGVAAARFERPLARGLGFQAGTAFFWYSTQSNAAVAMLLPEAAVTVRAAGTPLVVIVGAGRTFGVKGELDDDFTLHAALAFDIEDRAGWAIRPEIRVRAVDPWAATIADFTLGVRRMFSTP